MRICSICGERNEDWMEICQRCGNSIANADKVEYKAKKTPEPVVVNNIEESPKDDSYSSKPNILTPKKPIENMDLKLTLLILSIILFCLILYTLSTII